MEIAEETKKCDFCGEKVLAVAKKCKHCGETLDVFLRMAEEAKKANSSPNVFMNAGGGASAASAASSAASAVAIGASPKKSFPHGWHLFLSIITLGWWLIIWALHYLFRDRNYYN